MAKSTKVRRITADDTTAEESVSNVERRRAASVEYRRSEGAPDLGRPAWAVWRILSRFPWVRYRYQD